MLSECLTVWVRMRLWFTRYLFRI